MSGSRDSNWTDPVQGSIEGEEVTASFGTGSREGETLLSDGHTDADIRSGHHDHYGSGDGPNDNGTDRGAYTGPGSTAPAPSGDWAERMAAYGYGPRGGGRGGRRGGGRGRR